MNKLKTLVASFTIMSALAITVRASETQNPPCVPGEMHGPPCSSQPAIDNSIAPGAANIIDAAEAALWSLLLF